MQPREIAAQGVGEKELNSKVSATADDWTYPRAVCRVFCASGEDRPLAPFGRVGRPTLLQSALQSATFGFTPKHFSPHFDLPSMPADSFAFGR